MASPQTDGGKFHSLPFEVMKGDGSPRVQFRLSKLEYWDPVFLETRN